MEKMIQNGISFPKINFNFEIDVSAAKTLFSKMELKKLKLPSNYTIEGSLSCIDQNYPIFKTERYQDLEQKVLDWLSENYSPSEEICLEKIIKKIKIWIETAIQCAICMFPSHEPRSPQMWAFIQYTICGYLIDDWFEKAIEIDAIKGVSYIKEIRNILIHDMRTPPYIKRELTQHPLFKKFPILRTIYNIWIELSKYCSTIVENYEENGQYWLNELEIWIQSVEWQSVAHKQGDIVFTYVRGINAGGSLSLEYLAMLGGAYIPTPVRNDIAFRQMNISISNITALINDLLGVAHELNKDETIMNKIFYKWRKSGSNFMDCFQEVVQEANFELKGGFIACQKLLAEFPGDANVEKIVKTFVELSDGHMIMFTSCTDRYGVVRGIRTPVL